MAENMRDMTLNLIVNSQVGRIKDFNRNLKDTEKTIERTTKKSGWLSRNLGRIFVTYFGIQGVKGMINTYRNLDLVRRSIEGLTKSTQDWDYIQQQAFKTGTGIETVAKGYRNFYSAANMAGFDKGGIQEMYSEVLIASRAIGANQTQVNGALLALEQMLSKGKVSMEELRRQLGNALPGAFEIGAKAMGVTTQKFNEMIKAGVSANEFVPKFTRELLRTYEKAFPEAVKSLDYAIVNLDSSWKLFQYDLMRGGAGQELAKVVRQIASILTSSEMQTALIAIGKSLNAIMSILSFLLRHLKEILFIISPLVMGAAIDKLIKSVAILVGWIRAGNLALSVTQRWMLLIFAGIVMLDEVIALFQKGRKSVIKTVLFGEEGVSGAMRIVGALSMIAGTLITIGGALAIINKFKGVGSWLFPNKNVPKPTTPNSTPIAEESSIIDPRTNKPYRNTTATDMARKTRIRNTTLKMGAKIGAKAGLRAAGEYLAILPFSIGAMQDIYGGGDKKRADEALRQIMEFENRRKNSWTRDFANANLTKSETYAPNITYNPQYHIDATGLTPEELVSVLDERDRNFWMSLNKGLPSVTSKGSGYSSLFPLSGGIR